MNAFETNPDKQEKHVIHGISGKIMRNQHLSNQIKIKNKKHLSKLSSVERNNPNIDMICSNYMKSLDREANEESRNIESREQMLPGSTSEVKIANLQGAKYQSPKNFGNGNKSGETSKTKHYHDDDLTSSHQELHSSTFANTQSPYKALTKKNSTRKLK